MSESTRNLGEQFNFQPLSGSERIGLNLLRGSLHAWYASRFAMQDIEARSRLDAYFSSLSESMRLDFPVAYWSLQNEIASNNLQETSANYAERLIAMSFLAGGVWPNGLERRVDSADDATERSQPPEKVRKAASHVGTFGRILARQAWRRNREAISLEEISTVFANYYSAPGEFAIAQACAEREVLELSAPIVYHGKMLWPAETSDITFREVMVHAHSMVAIALFPNEFFKEYRRSI